MPEWINLLPAGDIRTVDGRGPYRVRSLQSLIAASLKDGGKLPIDECHATDKGAPLGLAAPARGWIVELQEREGGLWGRVEWNGSGRALMEDKAYVGVSPVIMHSQNGEVHQLLRASLTNTPNLQGMVSLHSENTGMDWKAKLIELLGLDGSADDAAIMAALEARMNPVQSEHGQNLLQHPTVVALQSQLTDVTNRLNTVVGDRARDTATAFVDAAIAEGRVGVKPARDEYIALHMQDPARAMALVAAMPVLGGGSTVTAADPGAAASAQEFTVEDRQIMSLFGVSEDEYRAELKARGLMKEVL